jgi:cell division protein FtsI (penicillin-binding protein 3)
MLGRTDRRLRIVLLLVLFVAFATASLARLGYWQVARGAELQQMAVAQLQQPIEEPAIRGDILDRNGVVLATTAFRDTLSAYPDQVAADRVDAEVDSLSRILGLSGSAKRDLLARFNERGKYLVVQRELTDEQSAAVEAALADGTLTEVTLEPHAVRVYPNPGGAPGTTLASQLLGFVSTDGTGHYGIEQYYDSILAGRPKVVAALRDPSGQPLESTAQVLDPGTDGQDIRLTIDAGLQLQLEKELYAAWVADAAQSVSGVILDPQTGAVLAWATVPGYDANNYAATASAHPELLQDPIVSQVYEPGSVMKMFTASAALQAGTVKPSTMVHDHVSMTFGGQVIHNSDHRSMGKLSFRDAIAYSRNLAVAGVAMGLDKSEPKAAEKLYQTWHAYGIGSPTGIDLFGEVAGIAPDPAKQVWQPVDLADRAFGQGVAVTQVQLATGFAAMTNGGYRIQPHLVSDIQGQAQTVPDPTRIISSSLAAELKGVLAHVTSSVPTYAAGSLIHGYLVGGKTGTAQVWDPSRNRYTINRFNFSFVGYVGGDQPSAVIAVRIANATPKALGQGDLELGITSFQLFRRIAVDSISELNIPKSSDPNAGYPEPGSAAEERLYPQRYAQDVATKGSHHGGGAGGG